MMKTSWFICAMIVLLSCGCNDDKEKPEPQAPEKSLQTVLAGNYWEEHSYFRQNADGVEQVSKDNLIGMKYADILGERGFNHKLGLCYFRPDGQIDRYSYPTGAPQDVWVYRDSYAFECTAKEMLRLIPEYKPFKEEGWFTNMTLHVRSMTDERIEFDMPINDYTRREWASFIDANTKGIRTVLIRVDDTNDRKKYGDLENAKVRELDPV